MLRYTGHPFYDIGVAAITAYSNKRRPEEVTSDDLEKVAQYIEDNYTVPPLTSFLNVSLMNSDFTQFSSTEEGRRAYARIVTRSFDSVATESDAVCVFTGEPVSDVVFKRPDVGNPIPPGRAFRQHIPMMTGEGVINFSPEADAGLPISGKAMLALQFFPMGCAKVGVGLLAVYSENERLMFRMARDFLKQNVEGVAKAQAAQSTKLEGAPRQPKTLLIETLTHVEVERTEYDVGSVTAFNFNNSRSGQLELFYLPLQIIAFLRAANTSQYRDAWQEIVRRGWARPPVKKKDAQAPSDYIPKRNYLYNDIFDLPNNAARFIRTYFLRTPHRASYAEDPRQSYSTHDELRLVSWPLLELFLKEVLRMEEQRLTQIRALGDGLAIYVRRQGGSGKAFFREFFTERRPDVFRGRLIRANIIHQRDGQPSLFDMDTYIDVFEDGIELMRPDWRLARDLVYMRMVDQLRDWLNQNPDAMPDQEVDDAGSAAS